MSMSCSLMPPFDETVDGQIFTVFWDCLNYSYVIFVYSSFLLSGGAVVQWLRHHFWHTTQLLSHLPVVHCLVMKAPMTSGARQLFRPDALPAWCHQWRSESFGDCGPQTQRTCVWAPLSPYESLVAAGRAYGQHCCWAPVKVSTYLLDTSQHLSNGVNDVKFGRRSQLTLND